MSETELNNSEESYFKYLNPEEVAKAEKQIAETSVSDMILGWLRNWKCTTSTILNLQLVAGQKRSKFSFNQALKRLKKAGAYNSIRVGAEALYFHDSYKKHFEELEKMDPVLRIAYVESSGIAHHIDVQLAYVWLRMLRATCKGRIYLPGPKALKQQFRNGLEGEPDLAIAGPFGVVPVEVERTQKSQKRWHEKWLEYECRGSTPGCLYLLTGTEVVDPFLQSVEEFFADAAKRDSKFWIATTNLFSKQVNMFSIYTPKIMDTKAFIQRMAFPEELLEGINAVPEDDQFEYLIKKFDEQNSKQN